MRKSTIKIVTFIEWSVSTQIKAVITATIMVLTIIGLTVAVHEFGHVIASNLLGYEYSVVPKLPKLRVEVITTGLDYTTLDPLIVGLSGGYLATAVLAPLTYIISNLRKKWYIKYSAKDLFDATYVMLASYTIFQFTNGTLEGYALQTNFITSLTAGVVANVVGFICFIILCVDEFIGTEKALQRFEDLTNVKILE